MVFKVVPYEEFLAMDEDDDAVSHDDEDEIEDEVLPLETPRLSCWVFNAFGQSKGV